MAFGPAARRLTALAALITVVGCGVPGPRALALGVDQCAHCHMTLADARFAGELVTATGKTLPFDDVGCLAMYVATIVEDGRVGSVWVNDFLHPDSLLDATRAVFLRSDSLRTPMDYHVVAFRPGRTADSVRGVLGGELLSWEQVVRLVGDQVRR